VLLAQAKIPQSVGKFSLSSDLVLFQFVVIRFTSNLFQVYIQMKKILMIFISVLLEDPK